MSAVKFFDDVNTIFTETTLYSKQELKSHKLFPKYLKSKVKDQYFDTLDNNITKEEFVNLLLYKTQWNDYISIPFIINHYNILPDNNKLPVELINYNMRPQALYTYCIDVNLKTHPMFSKHLDKLFLNPEKKIETGVFPSNSNFRYDACYESRGIAVEIDEKHHNNSKQNITDNEKTSLVKLIGKTLFRIEVDKVVNVTEIENTMYKDFNKDFNKIRTNMLDKIISEIRSEKIIRRINEDKRKAIDDKIIVELRNLFDKPIKANNVFDNMFNVNKEKISSIIKNNVKNITNLIKDKIIKNATNSNYLKECIQEIYDIMLCSLLNDYDFRQDYINIVFKETMIDELNETLKCINKLSDNHKDILEDKKETFNELKDITNKFLNDSQEFNTLFEFKSRSLKNPNNPNVVKFIELTKLLKIDDVKYFRIFLNKKLNIDIDASNDDLLLSWLDLNKVFRKYDKKPEIMSVLLLYYQHIDIIYENIIRRINTHNIRTNSNEEDYFIYMNRVQKKNFKLIDSGINALERDKRISARDVQVIKCKFKDSKIIPKIDVPNATPIIKTYNCNDLEKISRTNINDRFESIQLNDINFDKLCLDNTYEGDYESDVD